LKRNFAKLIKVKSIGTLMLMVTFCALVLRQNTEIPSEVVVSVITAATTSLYVRTKNNDKSSGGEE